MTQAQISRPHKVRPFTHQDDAVKYAGTRPQALVRRVEDFLGTISFEVVSK